ncbi:MAG: hypothetical protein KGK10_02675 [Rhodospirillales bacterium]|nr:hypothetical protein [Rhodospirillales bacterium]
MRPLPGLWLLRVTMAAIGLLLLVTTANLVEAATASLPAPAPPARPSGPTGAHPAVVQPPGSSLPSGQACPPAPSPAELSLLGDLRTRKAALDRRAVAIAARQRALDAAEKQVSARMVELQSLQKQIEAAAARRRQAASADTMKLTKLYEAMKPADAAAIFNQLDRNVLLQVLDAMNIRRAAAIMAAMQPARARLVTAQLAAMRARRDALLPPPAPAAAGKGG